MPRSPQFMDSESDDSPPGSPAPAASTPVEPTSPQIDINTATPRTKGIIKIVKYCLAEQDNKVKRKLDLMAEKQDTTNNRVSEIRHGMTDVRKIVQSVEANQRKAQKLNPKEALDPYQQKMIKRDIWNHIKLGTSRQDMLTAVYEKMRDEHDIGPAAEDYVRKFSQKDDSQTKSHLRTLVSTDLKNHDYKEFNTAKKWLKYHLGEDHLSVDDGEFLKIMASAILKFENAKEVPLDGRADAHNKDLVAESVENWWHYVANKKKKFVEREESIGQNVVDLMRRYGYEPIKKARHSI